jgi:hypothetical protein
VSATDAEFEYVDEYNDNDAWLSEQDTTAIDLDDDASDWREPHKGAPAGRAPRQVPSPGWPRDARRYAQREPELPDEDDEPVPDRQAVRRVSDSGVRSRADRASAAPRTARRAVEPHPEDDPGPGVTRAARRPVAQDPREDRGAVRSRPTRRPADREYADDEDRPAPRAARYAVDPDDSYGPRPADPKPTRRASERARSVSAGHGRLADDRTQILITRGRRSARSQLVRARNVTAAVSVGLALAVVLTMIVFRKGATWPPSVTVVQTEIAAACQNANVAAEPNQVNFACGKGTQQVLWVFSLLTSGDDPNFADPKSGRKGLEPITPAQGGEVAWSLDLHHPYDPFNPVDSLEVAARAINNIIGGASLTNSRGNLVVQPGLLSNPANCAKYTGSSAVIARAGYPDICAEAVTSPAGQAALVADAYSQWLVGAPSLDAQEASILFQNANDPGNPQVQAILKTLPGATATS